MMQKKKSFGPVLFITAILLVIVALIIALIISIGKNAPEISTTESKPMLVQISGTIPLDSNVLASISGGVNSVPVDDGSIFIPAGALDKSGQLVLTMREPNLLSEVGTPGWRRPLVLNVDYKDGNGADIVDVKINTPLEICFTLSNDLWNEYVSGIPMRVEVYEDSGGSPAWVPLASYEYGVRHQICGMTSHLSLFALAVNDVAIIEPTQTTTPDLYVPN